MCQNVKKMTNVKMSNIWTMEEVHKKSIGTMRFIDIDVNFDARYKGHQNWSKIQQKFYGHFEGFWWPSYVMSKLMS